MEFKQHWAGTNTGVPSNLAGNSISWDLFLGIFGQLSEFPKQLEFLTPKISLHNWRAKRS